MMASKAWRFDDPDGLAALLAAASPGAANAAGSKVRGFDERRWREARYDIVAAGNHANLSQHLVLRDFLRRTAGRCSSGQTVRLDLGRQSRPTMTTSRTPPAGAA